MGLTKSQFPMQNTEKALWESKCDNARKMLTTVPVYRKRLINIII